MPTDKAPYHDNLNLDYAMRNEPIFKELNNFLHSPEFGVDEWLKELAQTAALSAPSTSPPTTSTP